MTWSAVKTTITLAMSWRYRTPLGFGWTIPGTVLVGPALQHACRGQRIGR